MRMFRSGGETLFENLDYIEDYINGFKGLPKENVLKFYFKDGSFAAVRPSGTEPKLKIYYAIRGENESVARDTLDRIRASFEAVINRA